MSCNLTDAEWKLMHRLWEQSPQTITQLTAALSAETGWEKHTVITMLTRLEAKGAVRHEAGGRAKQFYPAVAQSERGKKLQIVIIWRPRPTYHPRSGRA